MSKRDRFPPLRPQEPAPPVWREWLADGIGAVILFAGGYVLFVAVGVLG